MMTTETLKPQQNHFQLHFCPVGGTIHLTHGHSWLQGALCGQTEDHCCVVEHVTGGRKKRVFTYFTLIQAESNLFMLFSKN